MAAVPHGPRLATFWTTLFRPAAFRDNGPFPRGRFPHGHVLAQQQRTAAPVKKRSLRHHGFQQPP